MRLLAIACLVVAVAVGLWAAYPQPAGEKNLAKAVDDLQTELEQVKEELSRLKGGRKWTRFWVGNIVRHINQCATHSDERRRDGPMCQWLTGFTSTPGWSDE